MLEVCHLQNIFEVLKFNKLVISQPIQPMTSPQTAAITADLPEVIIYP